MPLLLLEDIELETLLGIWNIREQEDWFVRQLALPEVEQAELMTIQAAGRRLEWLAARHLVKLLAWKNGSPYIFQKDGYGKPHLLHSGKHISISHSHGMSAAMLAPRPCGTDIQRIVEKISRLAPKFLRPEEAACLNEASILLHLHVFWGAKESLYKAYGRKSLDFQEHIHIEPFEINPSGGECRGMVRKDDFEAHYRIHYRFRGEFVWVYAMQD